MTDKRKRVGSAKGKRWAKRGSSSSNPQTKKHRLAAKSRFPGYEAITPSAGRPSLTAQALSRHEGLESDDDDMGETRSVSAVGSEFFCGSFEGTVFASVGQKWNSPQASHREVSLCRLRDCDPCFGGITQHSVRYHNFNCCLV